MLGRTFPARPCPFLRFPGKVHLREAGWEDDADASSGHGHVGTFSVPARWCPHWAGQSPCSGWTCSRCGGLRGTQDLLPGTELGTRLQRGARRGLVPLAPPAAPALGGGAGGRKCRALAPGFQRAMGSRAQSCAGASCRSPGCSPRRVAVPTRAATGLLCIPWLAEQCPSSPRPCVSASSAPAPSRVSPARGGPWTSPSPGVAGRGIRTLWGNRGLGGWCLCSWLGTP